MDPPERISQIMSTGVITVREDDLAALATSIMDWKNIHHVPVVDRNDSLIGLLTWTHVINTDYAVAIDDGLSVGDIMVKAVVSVSPDTDILEAIKIMKHHEIGCLPVTEKGTLVGIVTIKDIQLYDPEPIDG
jgi:predicted transcriptional regulator